MTANFIVKSCVFGSTPTTGTDIKPQKAQSFLGFFFCGMGTGVEQGGAAKPRTKVSSGDF